MEEDLSKLNLVELIDLLEPPPEPERVSMLPQTIGWLWLTLILLVLGALAWRVLHRRRARDAYRVAAIQELAAAGDDPARIAEVVRRTALTAFPRAEVAALHGEAWLAFLDRTGGGSTFRAGPGRGIATAPYRAGEAAEGLAEAAKSWIRGHRRSDA